MRISLALLALSVAGCEASGHLVQPIGNGTPSPTDPMGNPMMTGGGGGGGMMQGGGGGGGMMQGGGGGGGGGGGTPGGVNGLPCAVNDVLATRCQQCHSMPPKYGAPMPLVTWAD